MTEAERNYAPLVGYVTPAQRDNAIREFQRRVRHDVKTWKFLSRGVFP